MYRKSDQFHQRGGRMEKIEDFLSVTDGSGSGDGDGYGSGSGYGYGSGYGDGDGYGDGYGSGLKEINGMRICKVDGIETVITSIKNNVAKGFILNDDLTMEKCYIVKQNNLFAHGETLHRAMESSREKLFEDMTEEERIEEFLRCHEVSDKKYTVTDLFDWHNKLTGSCEMGRKSWMKNHGVSFEDEFTVMEFINLTKNDYGGSVIRNLKYKILGERPWTN